jgi:hypothetical protein
MTNVTCQISGSGTAARVRCPTGSDAKAASGKARISPKRQRRDGTAEAKFSVLVLLSWLCACACPVSVPVPVPVPVPVLCLYPLPRPCWLQSSRSRQSSSESRVPCQYYALDSALSSSQPSRPAVQPSSRPAIQPRGFGIPNASHSRPRYVVLYTPHVTPSRQHGY